MRGMVGPEAQRMQLCQAQPGRNSGGGSDGGGQAAFAAPACAALTGGGRPDLFRSKSIHHIPVLVEEPPEAAPQARKAWSVGY